MTFPLSRRSVCASLGAFTLAPLPSRAQTAAAIRIGDLGYTDATSEPLFAQQAGIFKKYGLDANISTFNGGGAVVAAVAGGSLDVGFANIVSAATAIQRGIPIVTLAPAAIFTVKAKADNLLVKARGSRLRTGADLNGKTVAVTTLNGTLQLCASAWIDKNGGDSKSVHFIELPNSEMVIALKQGRIDAAMLAEPVVTQAKADVEELGDAFAAIAPQWSLGIFVASKSWVFANPDAARRFVSAILETARWANAHHDQTAKILEPLTKIDAQTFAAMGRSVYGESLTIGMLQPPLDVAFKYGFLRQPFSASILLAQARPYLPATK